MQMENLQGLSQVYQFRTRNNTWKNGDKLIERSINKQTRSFVVFCDIVILQKVVYKTQISFFVVVVFVLVGGGCIACVNL